MQFLCTSRYLACHSCAAKDESDAEATQRRWGGILADRRREMGYSQRELAKAIDVSKATVSDHERGLRGKPHPSNAAAIERLLEWAPGSVDRVFTGGEPENLSDTPPQQTRVIDLMSNASVLVDELSLVKDPEERRRLIRSMIEFVRAWRDHNW